MSIINKTYTLRFIKLPPATIILGKPFDIIFSLTDDLGLEVPYFEDIEVAFSLKNASKESGSSDYTARDTATGTSTVVVNSYTGLLHKRTLKIDAGSAIDGQHAERIYLVLKLVGQSEQPVLSTPDLLERGLMEFVHTHTLLALPADGVLALVVPTYAGPLELQSSRKGNHSVQKVTTTEVHLRGKKPLRVVERPLDKIIGDHLWHGSIILAYAILHGAQAVPDARTIIELGAGCGLASLSIEQVLNDCEVTILATDLPEVVETTLSETLNGQNGWKSSVKSESLVWDSTNDCKRLLENISDRRSLWLLAADVLYNPSSHEAFLETMSSLCTAFEHSIVTIAYRPRTAGDDAFFDMASNRGFPFSLKLKLADVQIWQYCNAVGN